MFQGAVFFDYDGTLADEEAGVFRPVPRTMEALRALRANGYWVGLATGRSRWYVPDFGFEFDSYVTSSGAYVSCRGREIWSDVMKAEDLKRFLSFLQENDVRYILEEQKMCYCLDRSDPVLMRIAEAYNLPIDRFSILTSPEELRVNKIMLGCRSEQQLKLVRSAFGAEYEIYQHRTPPETTVSADVIRHGVSKAVGIEKVLERIGVPRECTYAFGDSENDLEMLQTVGTGIAMREHAPKLEEAAAYITGSVTGSGIYDAVKHFGLIDG